jgi:hypothetical protein
MTPDDRNETHPVTGSPQPAAPVQRIDRKLLELLVCPRTKTALTYDEGAQELISRAARLAYPIRDGIPIMLVDEARELTDDEVRALGKS